MSTADSRALAARPDTLSWTMVAAASLGLALALTAAAQIRIPLPFTPVPITLQTLVLYVGAAWLGPRLAVSGIGLYVGAALLGMPVMSGLRGGVAAFAGATGGYVLGWFLAAVVVGSLLVPWAASSWRRSAIAMAAGSAVILFTGALHLALLLDLSAADAILLGVLPFLPGDALKILVASALVRRWPNPMAAR
jgi:biotin transport system substrate-specific component